MYCANVAGQMIPPFFVYPEPKPRGYNTPNGAVQQKDQK